MRRVFAEDNQACRFCIADADMDLGALIELFSGLTVATADDVQGRHMVSFLRKCWTGADSREAELGAPVELDLAPTGRKSVPVGICCAGWRV